MSDLKDIPEANKLVMADKMFDDMLKERKGERIWRWFTRGSLLFMFVGLPILYFALAASHFSVGMPTGKDLVGVVRINGEIASNGLASAGKIVPALKKAFESEDVKAVILSIDSPGGAPVEAERIYRALEAFKAEHKKPVVAVINNVGASAAYLIAIHADEIYAGKYSLVGSVGAVLATWDFHKAIARVDVSQRVYASGELKSMLNPFLPMTAVADQKAQALVNNFGGAFISELKTLRGKKLKEGYNYGSGEVWGGDDAKALGLIDDVSTIEAVAKKRWAKAELYEVGPRFEGLPFLNNLSGKVTDFISSQINQQSAVTWH